MAGPIIHRLSNEFDDRNLFLQVTLGMISLARRWDHLLDHYAPPRPGPAADRRLGTGGRSDDTGLHLVLGLVSFFQNTMQHLERVPPPPPRPKVAADGAPRRGSPLPRHLLV